MSGLSAEGEHPLSTYSDTFRELRSPRRVTRTPRAALAPARGVQLSIGVMLPLTLGVVLKQPVYGVFAALGALPSGFAAVFGQGRKKPEGVALAAVGMALGAFVGALAANDRPLLVLFVAAFAYLAGIVGAFSDRVAVAALQWPAALLIATSTPDGPRDAAIRAGLVLAGGFGQAALVALVLHLETRQGHGSDVGSTRAASGEQALHTRRSLRELTEHVLTTVRRHVSLGSEHGQHALRLAVVAAVALTTALALGLAHPYWAALTALVVLKTEHVLTIRRGLDRIGGTAFGILFGLPLVALARFGTVALLLGAAASIVLAYTVFAANYFVYTMFLTGFVVVLLDLLGFPAGQTALPRLVATLVGGVIALAASHARPATV